MRIGLDLAPSAGIALAVVMRAASDAAAQWASSQTSQDTDLDSVVTKLWNDGPLRGANMRGRAFKIRQVFAELRHALGNEIPAIELLQLAAKLVDATRATFGSR